MHGASAAHRTALISGKIHIKFGSAREEKKKKKKDWKCVRTFNQDETPLLLLLVG